MNRAEELDLLSALGYMVFERYGEGAFHACGELPGWVGCLWGDQQEGSVVTVFPFLEVFVPDAEEFWANPGDRTIIHSDYWIQADLQAGEHCLRASAVLLGMSGEAPRKLLVIESASREFEERQRLVQYAHQTSLANETIAKLSRKLEQATEAKSEFLARMSHEIRTPMNALLGMAELLMDTPLTGEQRKLVQIFRRAGDDLLDVVNDILDFSKVEAGEVKLENISFDLADVLEKALEVVAIRAHAKGLELSGRIQQGVPARVVGDPGRLRQILLNLLVNAVKFTDRGEITVLITPETEKATTRALHFTVCDTGIGIPAGRLPFIFDRFTQVSTSAERRFGGTGLGLTISKRFVELMGGKIWAESKMDVGTKMHFTAQFRTEDAAVVQSTERAGLRCLVVDDNPNHRDAVAAILRNWGAVVTEADSPASARDWLSNPAPAFDLVLMDAQMQTPDDGLGLAARINEARLARRVAVMIRTDRSAEATYCRESGLEYLFKPVRRAELSEVIAGQGRQRAGQPAPLERTDYPAAVTTPVRILLADDSEDNRFLVRAYLKDCDCRIDEVENGALAVEHFRRGVYDLVITDEEMPVLDGFAAVRQMRSIEKELSRRPTPILALTAHALEKAKERSAEAGCTDHLAKPIRKSTLLEAVRRYAGEARQTNRTEISAEPWLKPIISTYLEKRRGDVAKLRGAIDARDFPVIRMLGHQMAGTGASYGFAPISEIGFALEASALSEDPVRIAASVDELDRYLRGFSAG